jgi:PEGA domain
VTFSPRGTSTTAEGERVAPFHGFGLSIESTPTGAAVRVDGRDVGETPIVTTVHCAPGREVEVRVEMKGHRPVRRAVRCRADALLELSIALAR